MLKRLFITSPTSVCKRLTVVKRHFAIIMESIATYEEVKDLPNRPDVLLIDVREPKELEDTGRIPTSINIPLGSLRDVLTSEKEKTGFLEKYGRNFPGLDESIIVSCRSGRRSQEALNIACSLGFTKVRNYKGSWLEWAEKEGLKSS